MTDAATFHALTLDAIADVLNNKPGAMHRLGLAYNRELGVPEDDEETETSNYHIQCPDCGHQLAEIRISSNATAYQTYYLPSAPGHCGNYSEADIEIGETDYAECPHCDAELSEDFRIQILAL